MNWIYQLKVLLWLILMRERRFLVNGEMTTVWALSSNALSRISSSHRLSRGLLPAYLRTHVCDGRDESVAVSGKPARKHKLKSRGVCATQRKCNTFIPHVLQTNTDQLFLIMSSKACSIFLLLILGCMLRSIRGSYKATNHSEQKR